MASTVQGFHTIVLQVSDLDRSIEFYRTALGVSFTPQSERSAQAKIGSSALLLHVDYDPSLAGERRGAGIHINFSVASAEEHRAELEAHGLSPGAVSLLPWGKQFRLSDPDGYVIEFLGPAA